MTFNLIYTEQLVRKSVARFVGRTIGWGFAAALVVTGLSVFWMVARGERSWVVGVFGAIFAIGMIVPIAAYFVQLNATVAKFHALDGKPVRFESDDGTFSIYSAAGSSTLPWSAITELWQYDDSWILQIAKGGFATFPLEGVPIDARTYVQDRVRAHGGVVR
jgi:YcxB-like protein